MSTPLQPRRREDSGFTLIELMVVVLIIAILLAIAIPTFLASRNSANARAAQSNLRNALTAEQGQYAPNQTFRSASVMQGLESFLNWTSAAPADTRSVAAMPGDPDGSTPPNEQDVLLEALSKDGNCYWVLASNDPSYGFTGYAVAPQVSGACLAPTAVSPSAVTMSTSGRATDHPGTAGSQPTKFYGSW